jgi:hypothetical protein
MIEMKCPSCGAGGRVPREKINSRLTCKRCLRVFYLNASGQAILGEPPAPKESLRPRAPREAREAREHVDYQSAATAIDELAARLAKIRLPRIPPQTIGIVAGVLLVGGLLYWFFSRASIEARSQAVAAALKKPESMKDIVDLAAVGTEMDAIRWYNDAYQKFADLSIALGGQDPAVKVQVHEPSQGGITTTVITFYKGGPRQDGTVLAEALQPNSGVANLEASLTRDFRLCWVSDALGNWRLDGTKTFEDFTADNAKKK